ncbi:trichohyalin-like [Stegastes partitus]|uniref:Trichohyalin-like n=1 Tax=Stegastes partitus TaxID=144197 RepID=A0A9Y4MRQ4_9TELE|nr:PREDICTED: trichohyalin-like [Stegastes partitus]
MGNAHTIFNKTPYTWYYRTGWREDTDNRLRGHSSGEYLHAVPPFDKVSLKYGNHSNWDLRCSGGGASYDLRESDDRQKFELVNNVSGFIVDSCPNFARLEEEQREKERQEKEKEEEEQREREKRQEEERRRREEEERRRQAQLERERRIQQQIDEENQASRRKLTQAYQDLQEEQNLQTRTFHQQQTILLHQPVDDHTAQIDRDEVRSLFITDDTRGGEKVVGICYKSSSRCSKCLQEPKIKESQSSRSLYPKSFSGRQLDFILRLDWTQSELLFLVVQVVLVNVDFSFWLLKSFW